MKKAGILSMILGLAIILAGCTAVMVSPEGTPTEEKPGATTVTSTTAALAVTDDNGKVVTGADGIIVTTIVTALPTQTQIVTDAGSDTTATQVVIPSHIVVGTDEQGAQTTSVVSEQTVTTQTVTTTAETTTVVTATTTTTQTTGTTKKTVSTDQDGWSDWV